VSPVASRQCTSLAGSAGAEVRSKTWNPLPSKRASPASVPTHRYPSLVCASACTVSCGSPFSSTHACPLSSPSGVDGSNARAGTPQKSTTAQHKPTTERKTEPSASFPSDIRLALPTGGTARFVLRFIEPLRYQPANENSPPTSSDKAVRPVLYILSF